MVRHLGYFLVGQRPVVLTVLRPPSLPSCYPRRSIAVTARPGYALLVTVTVAVGGVAGDGEDRHGRMQTTLGLQGGLCREGGSNHHRADRLSLLEQRGGRVSATPTCPRGGVGGGGGGGG